MFAQLGLGRGKRRNFKVFLIERRTMFDQVSHRILYIQVSTNLLNTIRAEMEALNRAWSLSSLLLSMFQLEARRVRLQLTISLVIIL